MSPPEPTSHQLSLISHYTFVNPVRFLHVLVWVCVYICLRVAVNREWVIKRKINTRASPLQAQQYFINFLFQACQWSAYLSCLCALPVLFDAGKQRLQPSCCAFTVSIQKGYDLRTWRENIRQIYSANTIWRAVAVDVSYVDMRTHLASGERRSLEACADEPGPLLHPHDSDGDFQFSHIPLQLLFEEI